jgi:hypothetical protein
VWNVQLYTSAENEKETVHILYKTKYGNEIGNPKMNLHVHNTQIWVFKRQLAAPDNYTALFLRIIS